MAGSALNKLQEEKEINEEIYACISKTYWPLGMVMSLGDLCLALKS